jgi:acyl transferase domain-containing protein
LADGGLRFEARLDAAGLPFLWDHRVRGEAWMPAAAYLEMALASGGEAVEVEELALASPLRLPERGAVTVQTLVRDGALRVFSQGDGWVEHAGGRVKAGGPPEAEPLASVQQRCSEEQVAAEGKPENVRAKIVDGKLKKFVAERTLLEQPYVRDDSKTVGELVKEVSGKLGEAITVRRFARFEIGAA